MLGDEEGLPPRRCGLAITLSVQRGSEPPAGHGGRLMPRRRPADLVTICDQQGLETSQSWPNRLELRTAENPVFMRIIRSYSTPLKGGLHASQAVAPV